MNSSTKYFATSFIWGAIAKVLDAGLKFITIPLLLKYFGVEDFGLLTLAVATNAYMQLLDMGMNTGGVKFFSQWIAKKEYDLIDRVARTNITFYLGIGLLNCIALVSLALWGEEFFNIEKDQIETFRYLLFILASFSMLNWLVFVFTQLLIASEHISFTQKVLSGRSLLNLLIVVITIYFQLDIITYFFLYLLANVIVIIPYYALTKKLHLIKSIIPGFYWKDFSVVFKYGLSILVMSFFQFTASQSRPLVLGMYSNDVAQILTDYRVIEVFPVFIISIGGMLITIFLPKASKAIQDNDRTLINQMAYEGTKLTSILVSILCFPIIISAKELLSLYVGPEFASLDYWLMLWVFTLTLFLHNSPVASLVLATGKTKMLVYSSAFSCILSIIINVLLVNAYGVGSAVTGYLSYVIIQILFYYLFFNIKILKLKSFKVFKSFIIPTLIGLICASLVRLIPLHHNSDIIIIALRSVMWLVLYVTVLYITKVFRFSLSDLKKYK